MATQVLSGSLAYFGLAQVLRFLQSSRATGCLQLERGDQRTEIYVEDGRSMFARTNVSALRIGEILVRRGELPPEAIEFVLAIQQDSPGARIGRMLVDNDVLTEAQMREAMLLVQRHVILAAMRWKRGMFRFGSEERIIGEDIRLPLDVDDLLVWSLSAADWLLDRPDDAKAA